MVDVYKEAVLNSLKLAALAEEDAERLYDVCLEVWGKELNSEQFAEEIIRTDKMIDKLVSL